MTSTPEEILEQALSLPDEERVQLGEALLDSVPDQDAEAARVAWREEVLRRIDEVRNGEVEPIPWSEVQKQIRAKLRD